MPRIFPLLKKWFLFLGLFLLLISPSLIITYYSFSQLGKQLTDQTFAERQSQAKLMSVAVEARLDNARDIGEVGAANLSGLVEEAEWDEAVKALQFINEGFPYADRVFLTDAKGILKGIYPPSPENIGKDFSFRDWYKGVTQNWQPYASEVFKRAPTPQFNTVAVAVPVNGKNGEHLGVLGLAMNLDSFYELTKNFKIGESGFLYIVNQKGQVVAHPKYPALGEIIDFSSVPVVQKLVSNQSGIEIAYNPVDKEERLAAFELVPNYNWGVVVTEPVTTAFTLRDSTLEDQLKVDLVIILLNCLLAVVVLYSIMRVRQANEKLKQLEKLKDDFVSLASHELRTPMGAIRSLIDTVLKGDYGKVPASIKDPLQDIQTSTERLIRLVNDMLNVSRIEAGRLKVEISELPLNKLIEETLRDIKPMIDKQKLELKLELGEEIIVSGDSDKVKQILNNLIGNSLKFTPEGAVIVTTKPEGEKVNIYVADTGLGISKEDQQKLFGKFQQITSAQLGKPAGSGLGLYFSRELVRKMGGELWIEYSDLGKGSIFAFSLPLANTAIAKQVKISLNEEAKVHTDQKEMTNV